MLLILVGSALVGNRLHETRATGGVGYLQAEIFLTDEALPVEERKRRFFDRLRPIIVAENARVAEQRATILAARDAGESGGAAAELAARYGIEDWNADDADAADWPSLLARVDTVPLTLALAQAANESNWGRSRFAQEGQNLFGQWCFSEGCGLVPEARDAEDTHEVARFDSINASVRAYLRNLNTGGAYRLLRQTRQRARAADMTPKDGAMADGLADYSARGQAYIHEIKAIIRANRPLMLGSAAE
ncbi:glucosaminidase domain-containing protein [Marivibrio halodurans]|uniref:Glucosaminidase domain-containing protein n=1 Tax=Marivibrio halodurans TaxID=2039722 RepID=A0A8J7RZN7_9PROT|nr:glucosaminidase domain-containing protein [Marivibrio halodurans]MBP5857555.1 glucosaminidase domain-containing protein [Marivibrio halodurans]